MRKIQIFTILMVLVAVPAFAGNTGKDCTDKLSNLSIESIQFENEYFYDKDGVFLEEKAKDAIMALLEYHKYPLFDGIRDKIFVMDYNSGSFAEVGLSGITYENSQVHMYMLMDIFLLPNQMLAEHWHVDGEETPAKREGWLVRWGTSYIAGIGEDNMSQFPAVKIPEVHWDGHVDARHIVEANRGDFVNLAEVLSKHWQLAGPEGAIITEVANFADGDAVKRSDPKMN